MCFSTAFCQHRACSKAPSTHVSAWALRALPARTITAQFPGLSPPCPRPRSPCQPPVAASPCPRQAGLVSRSLQPCPTRPWAPLSWAPVLAQPWPVPVPREVPDGQAWGYPGAPWLPCSWLGWWGGLRLPGPALTDPHGEPTAHVVP